MGMRGGGCLLQGTAGMGGGTGVRFGGSWALPGIPFGLDLKLWRRFFFIFPEDCGIHEREKKN